MVVAGMNRVRYGGGELPCVSAVVGALVAQETVKLVSHCYVPLNNCALYNAVTCTAASYKLPGAR